MKNNKDTQEQTKVEIGSIADSAPVAGHEVALYDKVNRAITKFSKNPKIAHFAARFVDTADTCIDYITRDVPQKPRNDVMQVARGPILFGILVIFLVFFIGGAWAFLAPIDSATHCSGSLVSDSNKKLVHHQQGGVVEKIFVQNGDAVKVGDPLIKLNEVQYDANVKTLITQLRVYRAQEARLIAMRDGLDEVAFDQDLLDSMNDPEVKKAIDGQKTIFTHSTQLMKSRIESELKQIEQLNKQIKGFAAQQASTKSQLSINNLQLNNTKQLYEKQQAVLAKLSEYQARSASLEGSLGELTAKIAQTEQAIEAAKAKISAMESENLTIANKELAETQIKIKDAQERLRQNQDLLSKTLIVSPETGRVNNLTAHTIGGVIFPNGQPIMEIIPKEDKLVVEANVNPRDIDRVSVGMSSWTTFSAFKSRITPSILGKVVYVSPDITAVQTPQGAQHFYTVRIEIEKTQFEKDKRLKKVEHRLQPGMQVDVLIVNGERTLVQYLLEPITDNLRNSFRE